MGAHICERAGRALLVSRGTTGGTVFSRTLCHIPTLREQLRCFAIEQSMFRSSISICCGRKQLSHAIQH
eukprot:9483015-Pyramimonas_sp.AAC.1